MGLSTVIAMGVFLFWFLVVLHGLCFRKNCPTYLTWPAPAASTFPPLSPTRSGWTGCPSTSASSSPGDTAVHQRPEWKVDPFCGRVKTCLLGDRLECSKRPMRK